MWIALAAYVIVLGLAMFVRFRTGKWRRIDLLSRPWDFARKGTRGTVPGCRTAPTRRPWLWLMLTLSGADL